MKPKDPGAVVDAVTVWKNGHKLDNRETIELDPKGSVATNISQACMDATAQVFRGAGGPLLQALLEGRGENFADGWKIHIEGMEFNEEAQSLRITGLKLVPIE